jgi:hypothetical protein
MRGHLLIGSFEHPNLCQSRKEILPSLRAIFVVQNLFTEFITEVLEKKPANKLALSMRDGRSFMGIGPLHLLHTFMSVNERNK